MIVLHADICDITFFYYVLPRYLENKVINCISLLILSILMPPKFHIPHSLPYVSKLFRDTPEANFLLTFLPPAPSKVTVRKWVPI